MGCWSNAAWNSHIDDPGWRSWSRLLRASCCPQIRVHFASRLSSSSGLPRVGLLLAPDRSGHLLQAQLIMFFEGMRTELQFVEPGGSNRLNPS